MKVVIQRVKSASVEVDEVTISSIQKGLLILLGITHTDDEEDVNWLTNKVANLRIFNDDDGVMNKSLLDVGGEVIVVSQFTLHASTKKGNRPSYMDAAKPDVAIPLYKSFAEKLSKAMGQKVQTGEFGTDMKVELINDGPVTILMDSKNKI